jgi:hypothetical protein
MSPETEAFLNGLFGPCQTARQAATAFITLSAIHPDGAHLTPSRYVALSDRSGLADAVDRLMDANACGWGAFVGIALRNRNLGRWHRGTKRDLATIPAVYIDIDQPNANTWQRLQTFPLPPSYIIRSSGADGGIHVYWLLHPTCEFTKVDRTIRGLTQCFEGDKCMNIASCLRLPGSINTKIGRNGAVCTIDECYPSRRYWLKEFDPLLPPWPVSLQKCTNAPLATFTDRGLTKEQRRELVTQVMDSLRGNYVARDHPNASGWIGSLCPFGHGRDLPGRHFFFNPSLGIGHCFGKHQSISLEALCQQLCIPL